MHWALTAVRNTDVDFASHWENLLIDYCLMSDVFCNSNPLVQVKPQRTQRSTEIIEGQIISSEVSFGCAQDGVCALCGRNTNSYTFKLYYTRKKPARKEKFRIGSLTVQLLGVVSSAHHHCERSEAIS